MSTTHPFVTVAELQLLLAKLKPTDVLATRTHGNTGNLPIQREGRVIGFVDVYEGRTKVVWYSKKQLADAYGDQPKDPRESDVKDNQTDR